MTKKQNQKKGLIVKHNDLIEACYNLTKVQFRLIYLTLSKISVEDNYLDAKGYPIDLNNYKNYFNDKRKYPVKKLIQELEELADKKPIKIVEGRSELTVNWISSVKIHKETNFAQIIIDPNLAEYLVGLNKNFVKLYLSDIKNFNKKYSFRLYELMQQYKKIGKRTITIDKLREVLNMEGRYRTYQNIKSKIIEPCIKEINMYTDISIDYKAIKRGNQVYEIEFTIKSDNSKPAVLTIYKHQKNVEELAKAVGEKTKLPDDYITKEKEKLKKKLKRNA